MNLEDYFLEIRQNTIGYNHKFLTPYGYKRLYYFDYTASGRLYKPIEDKLITDFGPYVGNTHSEENATGTAMTEAYKYAKDYIKRHVNADKDDVIITTGFGMTDAVNKLQRILGLRSGRHDERPVVFVTHMEHHSNHISWIETDAEVVVIEPDEERLVDLERVEAMLQQYKDKRYKIGAFTACSNVSGVQTPYYELSKLMHRYGGLCFIDFAASAPYVQIDMHPKDLEMKLDGIYFSPHKFLGGPGTSGVLVFDSKIYQNNIPDCPGGGTVDWTNPWGERKYVDDLEAREDGGTPGFLQAIKTALSIKLKEKMNTERMDQRDKDMIGILFNELSDVEGLHILAKNVIDRLGILSFYAHGIHYSLFVNLLNDLYGIQARSGCSCAGTYGHYLLHIDKSRSKEITDLISTGDLSRKPGWVRISVHPMMKNEEVYYASEAIKDIIKNIKIYEKDYIYNSKTNQFKHRNAKNYLNVNNMFSL